MWHFCSTLVQPFETRNTGYCKFGHLFFINFIGDTIGSNEMKYYQLSSKGRQSLGQNKS